MRTLILPGLAFAALTSGISVGPDRLSDDELDAITGGDNCQTKEPTNSECLDCRLVLDP